MEEKLKFLDERRKITLAGGGEKRIAEQHKKGKLTARERLSLLLDQGSFVELGTFVQTEIKDAGSLDITNPGEGVVTGYGTIGGRRVFVFAQVVNSVLYFVDVFINIGNLFIKEQRFLVQVVAQLIKPAVNGFKIVLESLQILVAQVKTVAHTNQ
jgi:hypothetical protein